AADDRWSEISEEIGARDIRALMGAPLSLGGAPVGSLNVSRKHAAEWDRSERSALETLAGLFETVLDRALHARRGDETAAQLQYALDNRVVIERAVGYVMGTQGVDTKEAFQRLRHVARSERIRVAELAERILAGDEPDGT
ncbi:MAG TPA: GAF and ANTAR domain-containing protein, partial [Acidimicrobiales bacterium]|nr:GAF and ANTAR domain-containing protein [Acidimicrobiales bacterium]